MSCIAYVCEGGGGIGWGHVGRGRSLAEGSRDVKLVIGRGYDEVRDWMRSAGSAVEFLPWAAADNPVDPLSKGWSSIVVDAYDVPSSWVSAASDRNHVAVVDDWQRDDFRCQVLVNANVGASSSDYASAEYELGLFGPRYAFVRSEILRLRDQPSLRPAGRPVLLLSLGGSDPSDAAAILVKELLEAGTLVRCDIQVVLGASYRGELSQAARDMPPGLTVLRQPLDFASRLARASLVVCGGSVTSYEAACLGRPLVPVAIVANQRRITTRWAELDWGSDITVEEPGWSAVTTLIVHQYLDDLHRVTKRAATLRDVVDGVGPQRVREALK